LEVFERRPPAPAETIRSGRHPKTFTKAATLDKAVMVIFVNL
jgi:hypothetical protein